MKSNPCCADFIRLVKGNYAACPICGNRYWRNEDGDIETETRTERYLAGRPLDPLPGVRGNRPQDRIIRE